MDVVIDFGVKNMFSWFIVVSTGEEIAVTIQYVFPERIQK
jgi:hypothetical protein